MRIISGSAKGLRLKSPHGHTIRPTSDRAREALFSILGDRIRNASVLDLFAGTGALGIEALSRGARHVTFVDNNRDSINLIRRNMQLLGRTFANDQKSGTHLHDELPLSFFSRTSLIKSDLSKERFYRKREQENSPNCYDVIFLDPPYAKGLSLQALIYLDGSNLPCERAIIVAEDTPTTDLPDTLNAFALMDKRRYGDTAFWLYKKT